MNTVKKIHELEIYPDQLACASKIMKEFNKKNIPILLIAEMQQGKTGTVICLISEFIKKNKKLNNTYQIIYIINLSDNGIKEQTEIRLFTAGLLEEVTILHHKNINSVQPLDVDARLIIIDECHVALGKEKPFHNFMQRFGIKYGDNIDAWENKNNYVVSVSATPYAHVIKTKFDISSFKPVVLNMSEEYYSLQHMQEANRIRQAEEMVDSEETITPYFQQRIQEFKALCLLHGAGYMIVRTSGNRLNVIAQHLASLDSISVQRFNCKKGNIPLLDVILRTKPVKPTVIIISGSLRAGKTLTTTEHIKMWLDSHSAKADTICQSVGRCLGYPSNGHSKFDDKFMVYCNTKELDACIDFFNEYECSPNIPSGNWNKKFQTQPVDGEYVDIRLNSEDEVREMYDDLAHISICSKNNEHNIAQTVLNGSNRGHSSKDDQKIRIYYLDAPNLKFKSDFNKLKIAKPELIGKFVKYKVKNNVVDISSKAAAYSLRQETMFMPE